MARKGSFLIDTLSIDRFAPDRSHESFGRPFLLQLPLVSSIPLQTKNVYLAENRFLLLSMQKEAHTLTRVLVQIVTDFNSNPEVHGILIQLPLPSHINEQRILSAVSIEKDVDGFHPVNVGTLAMQQRDPLFVACTPAGCIELLQRTGVQIAGKYAVVLGRSKTVGMPAALLLQVRGDWGSGWETLLALESILLRGYVTVWVVRLQAFWVHEVSVSAPVEFELEALPDSHATLGAPT